MFHCNGWCFPWTVAARRVNVCLRRVDPAAIFRAHPKHRRHALLWRAHRAQPAGQRASDDEGAFHRVKAMVAGPRRPAMIEGMGAMGFDLTHASTG